LNKFYTLQIQFTNLGRINIINVIGKTDDILDAMELIEKTDGVPGIPFLILAEYGAGWWYRETKQPFGYNPKVIEGIDNLIEMLPEFKKV
jgi:hypothetical protein